jgi:hypothetical protein
MSERRLWLARSLKKVSLQLWIFVAFLALENAESLAHHLAGIGVASSTDLGLNEFLQLFGQRQIHARSLAFG